MFGGPGDKTAPAWHTLVDGLWQVVVWRYGPRKIRVGLYDLWGEKIELYGLEEIGAYWDACTPYPSVALRQQWQDRAVGLANARRSG